MPFDQEMINIEFEQLESTEAIDSARVATATSHKEWRNLKFNRFFSRKTLEVYYNQGELTRSDHQTDLIQICQICGIAVWFINSDEAKSSSSIQSRAESRSNQCYLSGY